MKSSIKKASSENENRSLSIGETLGSATGGAAHAVVAGGWAGTDDDTSTAPSDKLGIDDSSKMDDTPEKAIEMLEEKAQAEDEKEWDQIAQTEELTELEELDKLS